MEAPMDDPGAGQSKPDSFAQRVRKGLFLFRRDGSGPAEGSDPLVGGAAGSPGSPASTETQSEAPASAQSQAESPDGGSGVPGSSAPPPPPPPDPLESGDGQSLRFDSLRAFRWPSDYFYLSNKLFDLLVEVSARYGSPGSTYEMTAEHLVATLLASDAPVGDVFIGQLRRIAMDSGISVRFDIPPHSPVRPRDDQIVLRWDVVELLSEASALRRRVNGHYEDVGTRHLAIAMLRTRSGQAALHAAGLIDGGIEPLANAFKEELSSRAGEFTSLGDDEAAWLRIAMELGNQKLQVSLEVETRVSYAADRAQRVAIDSLGVREDAAALSDLILLDDAHPPLAIGLFGPWGSGKSTLIKELQHRIHEDLKHENALAAGGLQDTNPATRRIRSAVQIEFNAWAFADSANLWASLTAEIFDQLAAGGIRPEGEPTRSDRNFAALVSEVKLRNSLAASALRSSDSEIADLESQAGVARARLKSTTEQRRTAAADAVLETAQAIFKRGDGPQAEDQSKQEKKDVEEVRKALKGSDLDKRIAAYAGADNAIFRWCLMVWDYAWGRKWPLAVLIATAAAVAMVLVNWPLIVGALNLPIGELARAVTSAALLLAGVAGFLKAVWPAIRIAGTLGAEVAKRKDAVAKKEAEVRSEVTELERKLTAARIARNEDEAWTAKFGGVGDGPTAASPALMLKYLMSDSTDVGALRQQQGIIAKVRRCFEQLDAVIARMRADPKVDSPVDRIVLYIDDLDRCDAEQVSNVLQAVHLLLAFECFVVVVAVDARWLKQSLETQHKQLKHPAATVSTEEAAAAAATAEGDSPATAADYLEKIFQIPLWVRPLVDEDAPAKERYAAYRKFVDSIARSNVRASTPPPASPPPTAETSATAAVSSAALVWTGPPRPLLSDNPRREGLKLSEEELKLMGELGPLAAKSPRAVKRMINLYRLLRVGYRGARLQAFLDAGAAEVPSYRELLFVLACETGLSRDGRVGLRKCLAQAGGAAPGPWKSQEWVAKLNEREAGLVKEVIAAVGPLTGPGMFTAVEEVRRYSFLP